MQNAQYRTLKDYRDPDWLGPRIGDKIIFSLVSLTLFWGVGGTTDPGKYIVVAAVLFMSITLPAFGAAAYTPALVLERPLFIRCVRPLAPPYPSALLPSSDSPPGTLNVLTMYSHISPQQRTDGLLRACIPPDLQLQRPRTAFLLVTTACTVRHLLQNQ